MRCRKVGGVPGVSKPPGGVHASPSSHLNSVPSRDQPSCYPTPNPPDRGRPGSASDVAPPGRAPPDSSIAHLLAPYRMLLHRVERLPEAEPALVRWGSRATTREATGIDSAESVGADQVGHRVPHLRRQARRGRAIRNPHPGAVLESGSCRCHLDGESSLVDAPVVGRTEQDQVVQSGSPPVGPVSDVMGGDVARPASGKPAAPIASPQGAANGGRNHPGFPTHVQDLARGTMNDPHHRGIAGEPAGLSEADGEISIQLSSIRILTEVDHHGIALGGGRGWYAPAGPLG